jgi:hypothetical protein
LLENYHLCGVSFTVEDEYKVGCGVKPMVDEELEVLSREV